VFNQQREAAARLQQPQHPTRAPQTPLLTPASSQLSM
jgi:hypothetical protein